MWRWFKNLFKIGAKVYETKNPDPLTKVVLDEVIEEMDKIDVKENE